VIGLGRRKKAEGGSDWGKMLGRIIGGRRSGRIIVKRRRKKKKKKEEEYAPHTRLLKWRLKHFPKKKKSIYL